TYGSFKNMDLALLYFKRSLDAGNSQATGKLFELYSDKNNSSHYSPQTAQYWWARHAAVNGKCLPGQIHVVLSVPEIKSVDDAIRCYLDAAKYSRSYISYLNEIQKENNTEFALGIQRYLKREGYYSGELDGKIGQATWSAFNDYIRLP
nr:peptidoglycan-binding protein [Nostoc sp. CHAB 5844]